jgi:hypothetical protein
MEALILLASVGLLTLLAISAMRWGADSREDFARTDRNPALRGGFATSR